MSGNNELEVFNSNAKKSYFCIYPEGKKLTIENQCWESGGNKIVFNNNKNEIFILDINKAKTLKINASGKHPIWLNGINSIAFINNDNIIQVYSLEKKEILQSIQVKGKLFSSSSILDYYWFKDQKKILIKVRYTTIKHLLWNHKEIIYDYIDKKSSR